MYHGKPLEANRWETSLLESSMRIHLVLRWESREVLVATEQPFRPDLEQTNALVNDAFPWSTLEKMQME